MCNTIMVFMKSKQYIDSMKKEKLELLVTTGIIKGKHKIGKPAISSIIFFTIQKIKETLLSGID